MGTIPRTPVENSSRGTFTPRWIGLILFLISAAVFAPSVTYGFINWDDPKMFVSNWNFRGFSWPQLSWMWTTTHMGPYQPLSWMTLALDYQLWGQTPRGELRPTGFHVTNVLLHSLNVVLVYRLAKDLLRQLSARSTDDASNHHVVGAVCAALLFGVHPLRVEVVAWATERRELLSTTFLLASVCSYLRGCESPLGARAWVKRGPYVASLIWFVLSLLSKAMGMTLPVVLLILDALLGRFRSENSTFSERVRIGLRRLVEKLPYIAITIPIMVVALRGQQQHSLMLPWDQHPLLNRLAVCCYGLMWYLRTTLLPVYLAPYYPLKLPTNPFLPEYLTCILLVIVVSLVLWLKRKTWPAALAAWLIAIVLMSPVLGLTQAGGQIAADRYTYLPCISWAILAGGLWEQWWLSSQKSRRKFPSPAAMAFGIVFTVLVTLTSFQLRLWSNPEWLWMHTAIVTSENATAMIKLGLLRAEAGNTREAGALYVRALEINPRDANAWYQLGSVLATQKQFDDAMGCFEKAMKISPNFPNVYRQVGLLLVQQNQDQQAVEWFQTALRLNPRLVEAQVELGELYYRQGKTDLALTHLETALANRPDFLAVRRVLAIVARDAGQMEHALSEWNEYRRQLGQASLTADELAQDLRNAAISDSSSPALAIEP